MKKISFSISGLAAVALYMLSTIVIFGQDTIPFVVGQDNRIYLKVTVNESEPLDFIFDTGAASMVANTTRILDKVGLQFDSEVENRGANGVSNQELSTGNIIRIGKFKRDKEELLGIAYPDEQHDFDGVIGYPFFEDYLIEIDYKRQHMVLHRAFTTLAEKDRYESLPIDMEEQVPFIDMLVFKGTVPVTIPVLLDTGFNGGLIVYHKMIKKYDLDEQYSSIGNSTFKGTDGSAMRSNRVLIPKATLGSIEFADLPAYFNNTPSPTSFTAILGGKILKEIHWVFDFKKQVVYVKVD